MGSSRPSRPAQLDPAVADGLAGGLDPQAISEISHLSAAALLDRVRHSEDPEVVHRVLTLVETVGVDEIAELWSDAEPDSLPGVLWRLYMLRTWMRSNRDAIAQLWREGEPVATTASAIAGVDQAPTEGDIARLADSILSGAFTGDFAVAMERAAAFTDVVALGLQAEARRLSHQARKTDTITGGAASEGITGEGTHTGENTYTDEGTHDQDGTASGGAHAGEGTHAGGGAHTGNGTHAGGSTHSAAAKQYATQAARLMHTASNLMVTAKTFNHAARLWRRGRLE
jgi:hypothetical protein